MPKGVKGSGLAHKPTETHHIKQSGKWFASQEDADAYRERQNVLRRAKRAGFGTSPDEIKKFLRAEEIHRETIVERKKQEARDKRERDRIRAEHGLHPKAHVTGRYAAHVAREEGRKVLSASNQSRMTDQQRVEVIQGLYRQRMTPEDMVYRIGRIVGVIK